MSDRKFLLWIRDRLVRRFGDDPNVDFVWKLEAIAMSLSEDRYTPNAIGEHPPLGIFPASDRKVPALSEPS